MKKNDVHLTRWSVLILCTGYGNELLRAFVEKEVQDLGFDVHVYDAPGYPVNPSLHSHASCVEAISSHDIVIALADEAEGGEFQVEHAPVEMIKWLRGKDILPEEDAGVSLPTIFQVEVMTARAIGKPTLVFIPKDVQAHIDQTITMLRKGELILSPRSSSSVEATEIIKSSSWEQLDANYIVPAGMIKSFRQLAFLEKLHKTTSNYISYYDSRDEKGLKEEITSRLSGVADTLIKEHVALVTARIEKKRNPVGTSSLQDLLNNNLIVSPPSEALSGTLSGTLFSINDIVPGHLAHALVSGRNVLLLGAPGLGKTTASLLTFRDIAKMAEAGVEGIAPLFAFWREIPNAILSKHFQNLPLSADILIRLLLGLQKNRSPWPLTLAIPRKKWILVLDGLDESPLDQATIVRIFEGLDTSVSFLVSCRQHDYDRKLQQCVHHFNTIIRLLPWSRADIKSYTLALRSNGKINAATFIEGRINEGQSPNFVSIPLWLSMLAFLAEKIPLEHLASVRWHPTSDYELLRICSDKIAEDEISRYDLEIDIHYLRSLWCQCAWILHIARREGQPVSVQDLMNKLGNEGEATVSVVLALLDTIGVTVLGFFHEVFQEYWLAEHLVDMLASDDVPPNKLAGYFSYQRSVVTNKLIRSRIKARENISKLSSRLRDAFLSTEYLGNRAEFTKNQIVYLLGRIDDSLMTKSFLRLIWQSNEESPFVKYSAAFASIMLGDSHIENEYYFNLTTTELDDQINRGYHLNYYGDINIPETSMPTLDNNESSAEATLRQLFRRLKRAKDRHLNLRRIELFTIRRFLETGRLLPSDIEDPGSTIDTVTEEARRHRLSEDYVRGVEMEAQTILSLINPM